MKYRRDIEAGKYMVETENRMPCEIIDWDNPATPQHPIAAYFKDKDSVVLYNRDGRWWDGDSRSEYDLYLKKVEEK